MTDITEWGFRPRAVRDRMLPITLTSSEADTSSGFLDKNPADQGLVFSLVRTLSREPSHTMSGLLSYRTVR